MSLFALVMDFFKNYVTDTLKFNHKKLYSIKEIPNFLIHGKAKAKVKEKSTNAVLFSWKCFIM